MRNIAVIVCIAALAGYGAEYSRVSCEKECTSGSALCCQLLQKRVEHRTPPSDCAKTLKVKFALDGAVKGEDAVVVVKDGVAVVRAGRVRGLVYGAGLLLRTISYGRQTFSVDDGECRFEPKKSLRMGYLARHFHNWYHLAGADEMLEYIDDLVLMGLNAFNYQYFYPEVNLAGSTPEERATFEAVSAKMLARIRALDCGFCENGGSNQVPLDSPEEFRGVPNSDPKRGNIGFNACPSKPGGMEFICNFRKKRLQELEGLKVDYFNHWPFDEGGCECEQCKPWGGNGFLRLIEHLHALNEKAHPHAKTMVSTWVFHDDDWAGLYKWLENIDWVDYILADSHREFPKYPLEHPVPKGIPIVTFPEISMWGRDPWGGYGATALPKRFARLFHQAERVTGGFMIYSEGIYEDINKWIVNGLYVNPKADPDELLRQYARYELPGTNPEDFVRLCEIYEANHVFPQGRTRPVFTSIDENDAELSEYRRRAYEADRVVERMDRELLSSFRESWRWRLVYLRAKIDREIFDHRSAMPETARSYFEEVVKIFHAERQLEEWRKTGKGGYTSPHFHAPAEVKDMTLGGSLWIAVPEQPVKTLERKPMSEMVKSIPGASIFVKKVVVAKPIAVAWWTVTGQGVFDAFINGNRVGGDILKPGFTHTSRTRQSFTYDVTELLKEGDNILSAEVSAGWWRDLIACYTGKESAFRARLVVQYRDGTYESFVTDGSWEGAVTGPVKAASIFEGEVYDAREGCSGFVPVKVTDEFKGNIVSANAAATVVLREDLALKPISAYVWRDVAGTDKNRFGTVVRDRKYAAGEEIVLEPGEHLVVDFGQNAAAVPRFTASAERGVTLTMRPAEMLNDGDGLKSRGNDGPGGSVYRANLRSLAKDGAQLAYTFAGRERESFMPRYTFFGYRYVAVEATGKVRLARLESVPVSSIAARNEVGAIVTGDESLNRLIANIYWGQLSNYLSVPTDCPQRDERLGWTADTQVFCAAATRNADICGFLSKWMGDMRDSQRESGAFPGVAPQVGPFGNESMRIGWSDAGIIVPYTMWKRYGDTEILRGNFAAMAKFMDHVNETRYHHDAIKGESGLYQWADWLSMEDLETCSSRAFVLDDKGNRVRPKDEAIRYWDYLGGCYWLWDARMMAEMAEAVGKDAAPCRRMASEAFAYLKANFFSASDGMILERFRTMQTPALFALKLGLVEGAAKDNTIAQLRKCIVDSGACLRTGFLGTSILMETLTENGLTDVAYSLLLNHAFPGWLYSVDQGATTIWERWNSYTKESGFGPVSMNSFNHYSYGAVLEWMYSTMAGIRPDPKSSGFRHFILAPIPDRRIGFCKASYRSASGLIKSEWRFSDSGKCKWCFTIPDGTSATVIFPDAEAMEYSSGDYELTYCP